MNYEELSISGFVKEIKDVSSGPHPRKFCFILGAGASRSSGIKSGQELVDIWEKELLERNREAHLTWKAEQGITEENKYSYYSQYYERRFSRQPMDGYNYLEKLMEHAKPSAGYVMLSHLLTSTPHNVVITTNFDHLTEDAVNYYAQTIPLVIGHEALAHYISGQITRPTIVKIHRDLLFDPKNKKKDLEKLHESWMAALDTIFTTYHPIFIGYAGNDNSLMDFLIENGEKFWDNEWCFPYWMLYKTDQLGGKALEFLSRSGGYCIRHQGFDETLYLMGAAFDYKIPAKEDFLSDAKKRFDALSNSIDIFTEKLKEPESGHEAAPEEHAELSQAIHQITSQAELQRMYRDSLILHEEGKYEEAAELKRKLTELVPQSALYHDSLSTTLHVMKQYEEARIETQKAVDLEPGNARYHDSLSITLHAMERYEEARIEAQKAVDLEPENASYHETLSNTLHAMGRYEDARVESQKAVDLEPENAFFHESLSATLHRMGRYEEARAESQKAVDLEPENAQYHDSLGTTLHTMGQYEAACVESQKAIDLAPKNAQYHNSLGTTLHKMGRYEEARAEKQKAVDLEPENEEYRRNLEKTLKKLESSPAPDPT